MRLRAASHLSEESLTWLWPGRLALGKLAMLDGDPGLGKSYLTLDLCARLSTGRPFADGPGLNSVGNSIVLNVEDSGPDILRPRLQALNADLERVFLLGHEGPDDRLRLPDQLHLLDDALSRTQARLVVLDPIVSFLDSSVCDNSNQSVRRALLPLGQLAQQHQCVVLMIRHLTKKVGGRSLYRGAGRATGPHSAGVPGGGAAGAGAAVGGRRVGGLDFGFRNPFAAVAGTLDRDGVLWLTFEHYQRGRPLSDHAAQLPRDVVWYADPSGANERGELIRAGFMVHKGTNVVGAGIAAVTARLGEGTVRIAEGRCPNLLAEAQLYRYDTGGETESPLGEHNHALDALRYLISGLDAGRQARSPHSPSPVAVPAAARQRDPMFDQAQEHLWDRIF